MIPEHMQEGSRGPFVTLVMLVFHTWWIATTGRPSGIDPLSGVYNVPEMDVVHDFQETYGLATTGGFNPETREKFEQVFDIRIDDIAARAAGTTTFVQLDGSAIPYHVNLNTVPGALS